MKHFIVGMGNLGTDIYLKLKEKGETFELNNPDYVWCTAGAGGPGYDFEKQIKTHVLLPYGLIQRFPNSKIILFSTMYLHNDHDGKMSHYALTKKTMETMAIKYHNVTIYRVGSLYGTHFPTKTFPGKIVSKLLNNESLTFPVNIVAPTPTAWLAEQLVNNLNPNARLLNLCPSGFVSIYDWAKLIAKQLNKEVKCNLFDDPNYPGDCTDWLSDKDSWESLWETHGVPLVKQLAGL